jgi:hypothetical protein
MRAIEQGIDSHRGLVAEEVFHTGGLSRVLTPEQGW